jgi:hypothetical protein
LTCVEWKKVFPYLVEIMDLSILLCYGIGFMTHGTGHPEASATVIIDYFRFHAHSKVLQ